MKAASQLDVHRCRRLANFPKVADWYSLTPDDLGMVAYQVVVP